MEAAINKPDNQFKDLLNDITDFTNLDTCNARIKELSGSSSTQLTSTINNTKPANSLNSSTYSSAASSSSSSASSTSSSVSSSSSSSTTSDLSATNPASSASSSTLSSPSQTSETNNNCKPENNENIDNGSSSKIEIARIEDLGKKAMILGHKGTTQHYKYSRDNISSFSTTLHSDKPNLNANPITAKNSAYKFTSASNTISTTNSTAINHNTNTNLAPEGVVPGDIWKTINGKRDKKRRKPTEQPVLSEDIPGHKGTREVDWLVNFIKSGTNGPYSTSSSNKNNTKSKVQNKLDNTNHNSAARNRSSKNSNSSPAASASTTNSTKRQESFHTGNQKSHQALTKMSSHSVQTKSTTQFSCNQIQPTSSTKSDQGMSQTSQTQNRKQTQANQNNEAHNEDLNVTNNIAEQQAKDQYKPAIVSQLSQTRNMNNRHKGPSNSLIEQSQKLEMHSESSNESIKFEPVSSSISTTETLKGKKDIVSREDIVTFADHIRVDDKELGLYTFGFFDEASANQATTIKPKSNRSNHISNEKKVQKQSNQMVREIKIENTKASPNSEKKRRKFNDNIDTNSFNYNQVLEFISNAWESTAKLRQAKSKATTHGGR